MPCLKDPAAEARRIVAVKAALTLSPPWLRSTGPKTAEGKLRAAHGRAWRHGLDSLALKFALRYITAVEQALSNK